MRNDLVSIVIPVYNAVRYLDRCMESLVNQTYDHIEIILVDDCSKDQSLETCRKWEKKDTRVIVVSKAVNEGAGMARNTGMEKAVGKYIMFVDSDDYLALDTIEKCLITIGNTEAQAVVFGHCDVDRFGEVKQAYCMRKELIVYEKKQVREKFLPDLIEADPEDRNALEAPHARAMMFEVQPLRRGGWRFVSEREIASEDVYSLMEAYSLIEKVAIIPEVMYYYRENDSSITHSYSKGYYERIKPFYFEMVALSDRLEYDPAVKLRIAMVSLSFVIAAMKQEMAAVGNGKAQRRRIKEIVNDEWLQSILRIVKRDRHNRNRNILFHAMRYRWCFLCWMLVDYKRKQAE